ncbi:MAG: mercuric reductase [Acidobacteriaceae bacterium]|jgi:pyruvate/2-oxoglutarate dehydrogenase complex dihydrolipoamide dehydrogenase (E3) component
MTAETSTPDSFDAIIIGSGQGGNPLAEALIAAGKKTAMIERQDVGGTCINRGCSPTKTMVASARVAYLARRGTEYGVNLGSIAVDMGRVRERKRAIVSSFRQSRENRLAKVHADLVRGEASFVGPRQLRVALRDGGERRLTAAQIFIDTGTRSAVPSIPGLDTVPHLDNDSIMELDRVPQHLVVLGGGYIGVEFSQMFRRFGSKVTVIQRGPQLLGEEDEDVVAEVAKILRQDGIEILLNARTDKITQDNGRIRLELTVEGKAQTVDGSDLLVATGRVPNTGALKPAAGGIETDERGFIRANERLETTAPGVYVTGDVKGGPQFTHISYDDFRILKTNLLDGGQRTTRDRMVPYTVFMDPQLGRVGMTEKEAQKSGRKIRVARMPMTSVARALEVDETRGLMKAIVDAETEEILGATVLGIEGGEVMSVFQMAMMGHLKYGVLHDAIFAHPTLAESLNNLFLHFDDGQP